LFKPIVIFFLAKFTIRLAVLSIIPLLIFITPVDAIKYPKSPESLVSAPVVSFLDQSCKSSLLPFESKDVAYIFKTPLLPLGIPETEQSNGSVISMYVDIGRYNSLLRLNVYSLLLSNSCVTYIS